MSRETWPLSNPAYTAHPTTHVPFAELTSPVQFVAEGVIALCAAVGGGVARSVVRAQRMWRINNTMDALAELDDRILSDIGVSREQIPHVAVRTVDHPESGCRRSDRK